MHYSLVIVEWVPVRTALTWRWMRRVVVLNCAVHSVSQSCPINSRALEGKCGKMCACRAAFGREGKFSLHVFAEVTMSPFGIVTSLVSTAICLFAWRVEELT